MGIQQRIEVILLEIMSVASTAAKKIVPLLDRILVQRIKPQEKTKSGILIPEKAQEALNRGEVLACGPGMMNKEGKTLPVSVKVGDKVVLPNFTGNTIKVDNEEFVIVRDSEILAKVN
eukprot:NODE_789_length_3873_cov_0.228405.p7 type:complete len:118 gc:universal NODE_789_length_3873_cov_0.228405:1318-965(-)